MWDIALQSWWWHSKKAAQRPEVGKHSLTHSNELNHWGDLIQEVRSLRLLQTSCCMFSWKLSVASLAICFINCKTSFERNAVRWMEVLLVITQMSWADWNQRDFLKREKKRISQEWLDSNWLTEWVPWLSTTQAETAYSFSVSHLETQQLIQHSLFRLAAWM